MDAALGVEKLVKLKTGTCEMGTWTGCKDWTDGWDDEVLHFQKAMASNSRYDLPSLQNTSDTYFLLCMAISVQSLLWLIVQIFCQALQVHNAAQKKSSNGMPPDHATILMKTAGQCSKINSERPVEGQFDQLLLTSALIDRKREQLNQNCNTY